MASNNNVYSGTRTYINASHLARAASDNGSGNILWSRDIDWGDISSDLGTLTSLFIISKLEELSSSLSALDSRVSALENQTPTPQLTLSSTSGTIVRPKGSLSSIAAVGGSDEMTITVGSTGNITHPSSLTLTYGTNTNKTVTTPNATYNGATVQATWASSNTSVATVSGTNITATGAGSATLTASYEGKTATYSLTVTNESTSGSINTGWTYTSDDTNIATISTTGTKVTGVAQGTTEIKVNYEGKTCDLPGKVTVNAAPKLTLSSTSGTIVRPKGSLSSIAAVGGSDEMTITVGSTGNITHPSSLTLTYGTNTNKTVTTPNATYNGATVQATWASSNTSVATVSGTNITATGAGSATLTASYEGKTATYSLTVTNESTSGSINTGWTYASDDTRIATISTTGTKVTGVAQGTTEIKVNYEGKTCDLPGKVTVNAAAPQINYYYYAGWTQPTASNVDTIIAETYLSASSGSTTTHTAGKKTTSKSTMDYTSNTLYNANAKATYYVLVPTDHAIYDSLNNNVISSVFTSKGNIYVGNQTHTVYASNSTSRNINAIIIK